jgi:hypothetical protein
MGDAHGAGNGARLRLARQPRGFPQRQVAAMAAVSRRAVSADMGPRRAARPAHRWAYGPAAGRESI